MILFNSNLKNILCSHNQTPNIGKYWKNMHYQIPQEDQQAYMEERDAF